MVPPTVPREGNVSRRGGRVKPYRSCIGNTIGIHHVPGRLDEVVGVRDHGGGELPPFLPGERD